tara:strand:- start:3924 stop:4178 length:255 start_codon:yes stop_codon:yes gene_type:complete
MDNSETLKKKILYRANYRGTKEMDILLSSFVKKHIDKLSNVELNDLKKFLDLEDEIIFNFYQNNTSNILIKKNKITELFKEFKI